MNYWLKQQSFFSKIGIGKKIDNEIPQATDDLNRSAFYRERLT